MLKGEVPVDDETRAVIAAMQAEIAWLKGRLDGPEETISLMQYARRIGYPRTSARRRMLAEKIGQRVAGRWRIKI
jgi:hypothetical protein